MPRVSGPIESSANRIAGEPGVGSGSAELLRLALAQRTRADFQVGPARLDGDEHLRLLELGLGRITGSEALLLLGLAEQGAELARDALAKPVDAGLGMLPGARHCESHCVPPACTIRAAAGH